MKTKLTLNNEIYRRFALYYLDNPAWGILHVALDDENYEVNIRDEWLIADYITNEERELAALFNRLSYSQRKKLREKAESLSRKISIERERKKYLNSELENKNSNIGSEYLNRDIYYITQVQQVDGSSQEEVRLYKNRGSYLSPKMMRRALELELEFWNLNESYRKKNPNWFIRQYDVKQFEITD